MFTYSVVGTRWAWRDRGTRTQGLTQGSSERKVRHKVVGRTGCLCLAGPAVLLKRVLPREALGAPQADPHIQQICLPLLPREALPSWLCDPLFRSRDVEPLGEALVHLNGLSGKDIDICLARVYINLWRAVLLAVVVQPLSAALLCRRPPKDVVLWDGGDAVVVPGPLLVVEGPALTFGAASTMGA